MNSQKELILYQLANIINSMCYYSIPARLWDGSKYPDELDEPVEALKKTGKIEYWLRGGSEYEQRPTEEIIPGELLSQAASLVNELDDLEENLEED